MTLVSFWHFTVVRGQTLTPSVAFTSVSPCSRTARLKLMPVNPRLLVSRFTALIYATHLKIGKVFDEMKFALNAIPETLINMLQVRNCFQDLL